MKLSIGLIVTLSLCSTLSCSQRRRLDPLVMQPGDKVVYTENHSGREDDGGLDRDVILQNLKNGRKSYITDDVFIDSSPALSPDKKTIAFISERHVGENIALTIGITGDERSYLVDIETGGLHEFRNNLDSARTAGPTRAHTVDWNPANGRLLYATRRELYESTLSGDSTILLFTATDSMGRITDLRVDDRGRYIALKLDEAEGFAKDHLMIIDLHEGTRRVVSREGVLKLANWTSDGWFYFRAFPNFLKYSPSLDKTMQIDIPDSISKGAYGLGFTDDGVFVAEVDADTAAYTGAPGMPRMFTWYSLVTRKRIRSIKSPPGCSDIRWYFE